MATGGILAGQPEKNMTQAREHTLADNPPYHGWDSGYNTSAKYRGIVTGKLNAAAITTLLKWVESAPFLDSDENTFYIQLDPSNGRAGRVAWDATAYPWRGLEHMTLQVISKWQGDIVHPALEQYNFGLVAALLPFTGTHSYYNYIDSDMPGGAIPFKSYWGPNGPKLLQIRDRYADMRFHMGEEWELLPKRVGIKMELQQTRASGDTVDTFEAADDVAFP